MEGPEGEDTWPRHYNPGSYHHLHALGVIAVNYASFERSLEALHVNKASRQKVPDELINIYYFGLNDDKKIEATRCLFKLCESDPDVVVLVDNTLDYFQWCKNHRDQILHAERYPASFGGDPDMLHLAKRLGRHSPQTGYMKFSLVALRLVADRIREGVLRCAEIHIHLRFRDRPLEEVPEELRPYVQKPLPQKLIIPPHLKLNQSP